MQPAKQVFKSLDEDFVVGVPDGLVRRVAAGEEDEDDLWANLRAWAFAYSLRKFYDQAPADGYESWEQTDDVDGGVHRVGVTRLSGPTIPISRRDAKIISFGSCIKVLNCSCLDGHTYSGERYPHCYQDGSFGRAETLREELIIGLYDKTSIVFANHRGQCLHVARAHLRVFMTDTERHVAKAGGRGKRQGPVPRVTLLTDRDGLRGPLK